MSFSQNKRILSRNSARALLQLAGLLVSLTDAVKIVEHGINAGSLDFDHLVEAKLNDSTSAKLLSRQRRYLVFPEGSSFQMGKWSV